MRYKLITLILFIVFKLNAQTEGISYQAVIIGSTDKELPGINASNNLLVSSSVSFEFTILDENDNPIFLSKHVNKVVIQKDAYNRIISFTVTDSEGVVYLFKASHFSACCSIPLFKC